jgi:hypothetical protein
LDTESEVQADAAQLAESERQSRQREVVLDSELPVGECNLEAGGFASGKKRCDRLNAAEDCLDYVERAAELDVEVRDVGLGVLVADESVNVSGGIRIGVESGDDR